MYVCVFTYPARQHARRIQPSELAEREKKERERERKREREGEREKERGRER